MFVLAAQGVLPSLPDPWAGLLVFLSALGTLIVTNMRGRSADKQAHKERNNRTLEYQVPANGHRWKGILDAGDLVMENLRRDLQRVIADNTALRTEIHELREHIEVLHVENDALKAQLTEALRMLRDMGVDTGDSV